MPRSAPVGADGGGLGPVRCILFISSGPNFMKILVSEMTTWPLTSRERKHPHYSLSLSCSKCVLFSGPGFPAKGVPCGRISRSGWERNTKAVEQKINIVAFHTGAHGNIFVSDIYRGLLQARPLVRCWIHTVHRVQ